MLFICYVLPFTHEQMLANQNATVLMKTTYIFTCILFAIIVHGAKIINFEQKKCTVFTNYCQSYSVKGILPAHSNS